MSSSSERPGVGATVLLLGGVVVFMAGLFGLYAGLRIGTPYMGLLFLLYWAAILRQERAAYLPSLLGGALGILLAWLMLSAPQLAGTPGVVGSYVVLAVVLFCYMRSQARLVVNNATMLYLAVSTIPELNAGRHAVTMLESLLLGAIYMGAVSTVAELVRRRFLPKGTAAAPA